MNKPLGVLFLVVATALISFITFNTSTSSQGMIEGSTLLLMKHNRKLKEHYHPKPKAHNNLNLEDYHLIDPVPSSKTTIRHKPIAHGSPLMPYIPKPTSPPPSPASPPKNDGPPGGLF
ncbi:hypothetical protein ACHQM5_015704 [Ranunculus cassubicifolius]